jgi:hypothetical protein
MSVIESSSIDEAFAEALAAARQRLAPPVVVQRAWPAVAAAAFFAVSALTFATAAILAPPAQLTPIESVRGPM